MGSHHMSCTQGVIFHHFPPSCIIFMTILMIQDYDFTLSSNLALHDGFVPHIRICGYVQVHVYYMHSSQLHVYCMYWLCIAVSCMCTVCPPCTEYAYAYKCTGVHVDLLDMVCTHAIVFVLNTYYEQRWFVNTSELESSQVVPHLIWYEHLHNNSCNSYNNNNSCNRYRSNINKTATELGSSTELRQLPCETGVVTERRRRGAVTENVSGVDEVSCVRTRAMSRQEREEVGVKTRSRTRNVVLR